MRARMRRLWCKTVDRGLVWVMFAERRGPKAADDAAALLARFQTCTCGLERGMGGCSVCIEFGLLTRAFRNEDKVMWRPRMVTPLGGMLWNAYLASAAFHAAVVHDLEYGHPHPGGDGDEQDVAS